MISLLLIWENHPRNRLLAQRSRKGEGGGAVGEDIFTRETGLSRYYFRGGHWRSWSAFQEDAGHNPNTPTARIPDGILLERFARLALERNQIPTQADLRVKKHEDPSFPGVTAFRRWHGQDALLSKLAEYCEGKDEFASVLLLLQRGISTSLNQRLNSFHVKGFVYLLRSGKYFKLGRSNAVGRRLRELAIQLPQKPNIVHVIDTDDPEGIEQYWHRRFEDKRQGGEWFALSADEITHSRSVDSSDACRLRA